MSITDSIKKIVKPEKKQESSAPKQTTSSASSSSSSLSASSAPSGNGNGVSTLSNNNNFEYENMSIFDDTTNKSGKEAMCSIQGSSFFRGHNDSKHNGRMLKQLNEIQADCKRWNVTMDADGDGTKTTTSLAQTIADSYDSVLDLYISEQVEAMMDKYGTGTSHGGYLSDAALEELAMKGIRADSVGDNSNRVYSFSLIDVKDDIRQLIEKEVKTDAEKKQIWDAVYSNDAVVMKDSNGKKGSCVFADCLVPDGSAQKSEINLASILDQMGYDCISKADFVGKESEYTELISKVEANINNGSYHELNKDNTQTISDTYGKVGSVRQALNTLWKHDTAGKGGGKFAHGLGDGSDAYSVDNFDENSSSESDIASANNETKTDLNTNSENTANAEASKQAEEKEKAEKQEDGVSQKDIKNFIAYEYERIAEDYKDEEGALTDSKKAEMLKKLSSCAMQKFGVEMTSSEICDIIF